MPGCIVDLTAISVPYHSNSSFTMPSQQLFARLFHDISDPRNHNIGHVGIDMLKADSVLRSPQLRSSDDNDDKFEHNKVATMVTIDRHYITIYSSQT